MKIIQWRWKSFAGLILLIAAGVAATLFFYYSAQTQLIDDEEARLNTLLRLAAADQQQELQSARNLLLTLAKDPVIRRAQWQACGAQFAPLLKQHPRILNISVDAPDGTTACSAVSTVTIAGSKSNYKPFVHDLSGGERQKALTLPYLILDNRGNIAATIFITLSIDALAQRLKKFSAASVDALILDSSGRVLSTVAARKGEAVPPVLDTLPVATNFPHNVNSLGLDDKLRVYSVVSIAGFPESLLILSFSRPVEELMQPIQRCIWFVLLLALVAVSLGKIRTHRKKDVEHTATQESPPILLAPAIAAADTDTNTDDHLASHLMRQNTITELSRYAMESDDLDELMKSVASILAITMGATHVAILQLLAASNTLLLRAGVGWDAQLTGRAMISAGPESQEGYALTFNEPIIVEDSNEETRFATSPLFAGLAITSSVSIVIQASAGAFGVLAVHSLAPRKFTQADINFLQSVSNVLSIALDRFETRLRKAYIGQYDALTGLPNLALFRYQLHQALEIQHEKHLALLIVNLDRFSEVGRTLGQNTEQILSLASQRLQKQLRPNDLISRFGGDKFAILLREIPGPQDAGAVAEKLMAAFKAAFAVENGEVYFTISVGVVLQGEGDDQGTLLRRANLAMYTAKYRGRNNYQFYDSDDSPDAVSAHRLDLENSIVVALDLDQLDITYLPVFDVRNDRITGVEAVPQWRHPILGKIASETVVALAEEMGVMKEIGQWMLKQIGQLSLLHGRGPDTIIMALSESQFRDSRLIEIVEHTLLETGMEASRLMFTVQAEVLRHAPDMGARVLSRLSDINVRCCMRNFDPLHEVLRDWVRLPFSGIKVPFPHSQTMSKKLDELIATTYALGVFTLVEGVQTDAQLKLLKTLGGDFAQGSLFREITPAELFRLGAEGYSVREPEAPYIVH